VLVLVLVPVFAVVPSLGLTPIGQGALALLRIAVALPLVALVVGAVEL